MRVITTTDEARQVAYIANGTRLAVCLGNENGLRLIEWWELRTGKRVGSVGLPWTRRVAFAQASRPLLVAHTDGNQIQFLAEKSHDRVANPYTSGLTALALTADGTRIAFGSPAVSEQGSIIAVAPIEQMDQRVEFRTRTALQNLFFDPTATYLVSMGPGQYTVWDLGRRESRTAGTFADIQHVAYSHDGAMLALASNVGATLFNADGSRAMQSLQRPVRGAIRSLAFSLDGRIVLVAAGWAIHVFDTETGTLRNTYEWSVGTIYSLAVAPDGLTVAAGSDGCVVIWDLDE